ncbi:CRTAC1 family protein [Shewanella goraebulensis]|uniref:CRTAC1 family protein n=1 Tax=Shewanella goraebulensis TaxID=3050637 RepID=UPI00254EE158|nr:CRTAC1 family protein [Shewanella goraebulensis]
MLAFSKWSKVVSLNVLITLSCTSLNVYSNETVFDSLPNKSSLLELMGKLESTKDPKCHATATRLEGLIYGTPLSEEARYAKTKYQKSLVRTIWELAATQNPSVEILTKEQVYKASQSLFSVEQTQINDKPGWRVSVDDIREEITARDQQHYGSIAYTLRAMLAVEQEVLLDFDVELPSLSNSAAEEVTHLVDLMTLTLLKISDITARTSDEYQITASVVNDVSHTLLPNIQLNQVSSTELTSSASRKAVSSGLFMGLIDKKIAAFNQYNDVNQTLFARNLQVYFAKLSMPKDEAEAKAFKQYFTEAMIAFSGTLYLDAQSKADSSVIIGESDVAASIHALLPHDVNEYEDVIFYPNYPKEQQVIIESYDMDAFRDSGLHWTFLKEALVDAADLVKLEADPFAAELLSEAIAHYGVLLLRKSGEMGKELGIKELNSTLIAKTYEELNQDIINYAAYKPSNVAQAQIISADSEKLTSSERYFNNVTVSKGVLSEHRSSDWLSRQLRSYLDKDEQTGIITIPPAFGGSGVAAEDINGDGLTDILILSGLGNKLFLNRGDNFEDVTDQAGLLNVSRREGSEKSAGEPRQPLIADLDNDGDQDIIITYVDELHHVYRNDGDGKFTEVSSLSNLGGVGMVGGPATIFDVNNDGLLDIYIQYFGNYLKGDLPTLKRRNDNGGKNVLFINKGDFKFEEAKNALGADNNGWGQAVIHTDLNLDGWQDLIVGNDFGVNAYYINNQGNAFVDYSSKIGTDKPSYTMNLSLSDLNRDGIPDIYVSNIVTMNKDQKYVLPSQDTQAEFNPTKLANMRVVEGNDLFLSTKNAKGALNYQHSDLVGRGYSSTGWAWDADFFDVDNDSDDDLYVLNGMNDYYVYSTDNPYYADPQSGESMNVQFPDAAKASNVFFLNSGGKLDNVSAMSGLDIIANSRSASYLDFDNDGDLDIVINNYHDSAQLFENQAQKLENNWLKIKLKGAPEAGVNLDGIGAQIIVGNNENSYTWRQVSGSQGYMSVHPKEQHFGLAKGDNAKVLVIWPNGERQFFENVLANRSYTIRYAKQDK